MTPTEIATQIAFSDKVVGTDQLTNRERFSYICYVFQVESIKLGNTYDFDIAIQSKDCDFIMASSFLASMQFEFSTRCFLEGLITDSQHQTDIHYLGLAMAKLRWALAFLRFGTNPPPYPFIN